MKIIGVILSVVLWCKPVFAEGLKDVVEAFDAVIIQNLADGRQILADSESGFTLYTFDEDDEGVSNCFDRCLIIWPAMLVESQEVPEPFSVHERPDGGLQLVLNGEPLYFFARDRQPLDINGDGVGGTWHLIEVQ